MNPQELIQKLREKADAIDKSVSRDKDDRDKGVFGEIELMRDAAAFIELWIIQQPNQPTLGERVTRLEVAVLELNPGLNWK